MSSQIDTVIDVAERFIGIKESPPGSNNVIFNTHYYGKEVFGSAYPWCAVFVWDVFRLCDISGLFYGGKKTASCATLLSYAKTNNQYVKPAELKRGDIVMYKFGASKDSDHTGIIADVLPTGIVAIEGNTAVGNDSNGGAVMKRNRTLECVVGAYRPDYKEEEELTFEQFEEFMNRYMSIQATGDTCSDWAKKAADALRKSEIVVGSEGDFGWKKPVTKETVAQMLYNYMKIKGEK